MAFYRGRGVENKIRAVVVVEVESRSAPMSSTSAAPPAVLVAAAVTSFAGFLEFYRYSVLTWAMRWLESCEAIGINH